MVMEAIDTVSEKADQLKSTDGRLDTNVAIAAKIAAEEGDFYSFASNYNSSNDDFALYFQNTDSTRDFHIVEIVFSVGKANTVTLFESKGTATDGSVITGLNWNFGSGNTATSNARQNPSGASVTPLSLIECQLLPSSGTIRFDTFSSLILTNGDAIVVQLSAGDASTCTTIKGFYK